jgi:hypothetical protein
MGRLGYIDKFGEDPDITTAWEDVRGGSANKVYLTSAETMTIVSGDALDDAGTAAGGAHKIVIEGLDANWTEQSETITMDGTDAVVTTTTWLRVNRAYVTDIGTHSSGTNVGTITVTQTTSGNLETSILAAKGQSTDAEWTVPASHTFSLDYFWANIGKNDDAQIHIMTREFGKAWRVRTEIKLYQSEIQHSFGTSLNITEKSDIKIQAKAGTGNIVVSAGFFGGFVNNSNVTPAAPAQ